MLPVDTIELAYAGAPCAGNRTTSFPSRFFTASRLVFDPDPYTAEQIIGKPREADVVLSKGGTAGQVCRQIDVTEPTYYRGRKEYGGSSPLITALYLTDPGSKKNERP